MRSEYRKFTLFCQGSYWYSCKREFYVVICPLFGYALSLLWAYSGDFHQTNHSHRVLEIASLGNEVEEKATNRTKETVEQLTHPKMMRNGRHPQIWEKSWYYAACSFINSLLVQTISLDCMNAGWKWFVNPAKPHGWLDIYYLIHSFIRCCTHTANPRRRHIILFVLVHTSSDVSLTFSVIHTSHYTIE